MEAYGENIALSEVILWAHVYTKRQIPFFPCTLLHIMVSCVHNSPTFFTDKTSKELTALKVLSESCKVALSYIYEEYQVCKVLCI